MEILGKTSQGRTIGRREREEGLIALSLCVEAFQKLAKPTREQSKMCLKVPRNVA